MSIALETRGCIMSGSWHLCHGAGDLFALVIYAEIIFEYQLRNRHDFVAVVLQGAQNIRQSRRGIVRRVVEQDNAARLDFLGDPADDFAGRGVFPVQTIAGKCGITSCPLKKPFYCQRVICSADECLFYKCLCDAMFFS